MKQKHNDKINLFFRIAMRILNKEEREKKGEMEKKDKGTIIHHQPSHVQLHREDLVAPLSMKIWMVVFRHRGRSHGPLEHDS